LGKTTPLNLLRLLEPAVRPGGLAGPGKTPREPIEQRSFESLLEEAGEPEPDDTTEKDGMDEAMASAQPKKSQGLLGQLAQFDRIENPSLRRLIAGQEDQAA
jgi:hypothetical protein